MATRPDADFDLLRRAYEVAAESHQGQFRASGDPYVCHPVTVATMMVGLEVDDRALCAAILHDTIDYTPLTLPALRREFGVGVASVVAGHVRLNRLRMRRGVSRAEVMAAIGSDGGPAALRSYNTGARPERQLRVRAVVHAGPVNYDGHGCYGRSLDTAFRLLAAPEAKRALRDAPGPLVVVTSEASASRADRAG